MWLLIVVSIVAVAVRRIRLPYTLALLLTGLGITYFKIPLGIKLTPELLLTLFLPALLFEGAMNIDIQDFQRKIKSISLFASFGVGIAIVLTGVVLHYVFKLPLSIGFLFGAIIVPTDPIVVLNIFKQLGISKNLSVIIEGESLFNDGTAIVFFKIILALIISGEVSIKAGLLEFFRVAFGGIALGFLMAYLFSKLIKNIQESFIQLTLTTVLAYGSYLVAENIYVSGVIAVVTSGLVVGNYGSRFISPISKVTIASFWEYMGFIMNSIVFLLIGEEFEVFDLAYHIKPIFIGFLVVLIARAIAVYSLSFLINKIDDTRFLTRIDESIPSKWQHVIVWGGIHGGLSMVLALSIPEALPQRQFLITIAFGVVFISLVLQGLTMAPLLNYLKLIGDKGKNLQYERLVANTIMYSSAENEIKKLYDSKIISRKIYNKYSKEYQSKREKAEKEINQIIKKYPSLQHAQREEVLSAVKIVKKSTLLESFRKGLISEEVMNEINSEIERESA
ncbi:Na+/H+ antiporter [Candidatus Woesearchaeota archaeon]|nr:Na+/H+ antiporter [Candidatus Woesearchaeota archaeon]